jgi:CubicO group peptidase (beta-lactamase class C family)
MSDLFETRRQFLKVIATTPVVLGAIAPSFAREKKSTSSSELSVTGNTAAELKPLDDVMTSFFEKNKVPGASLAVAKNGKLLYARGFGYASTYKKLPVEPDSIFRIASISKPFTAVAVMQLVEQGKLKLDDRALDIITLKPHLVRDAKMDPRWKTITIRQLLQHTGGWDRGVSFDPIGRVRQIAQSLDIDLPIGPEHLVRYMMGRPLDFDPGERYAYSNLGYLVLGRVIETLTKKKYEDVVKESILQPLGIRRTQLGHADINQLAKGEVRYYTDRGPGFAVVGPSIGTMVPAQYGAENLEGYEAHGGWIASAIDLVKFSSIFDDPKNCPLLKQETIQEMWRRPPGLAGAHKDGKLRGDYYGCGFDVRPHDEAGRATVWHSGLIAGTSTLLVHRWDGLNWAVLFNTERNADGSLPSGKIEPLLHSAMNEVKKWPDRDLFAKYMQK